MNAAAPGGGGAAIVAGGHGGGGGFTSIDQQLFDARLKANDVVQEHLKQITTIASATLALTVSFLKDVVGSAGAAAKCSGLLPLSWVALGVSILAAVVGIATLVNNLDNPDTRVSGNVPLAFAAGADKLVLRCVQFAIGAFAIGMLSLAAFGAVNYRRFLERKPSTETTVAQGPKEVNHFTIAPGPEHLGPVGKKHSHTFLLDQKSGKVWDLYCQPDGTVVFRRISVEGTSSTDSP